MAPQQHEIDLGDEVKINVKYAGKEYPLREPTVEEIEAFKGDGSDANAGESVVGLLAKIGMPVDVLKKMGMSKARQLVDGLMDLVTKKK